MWRFRIGTFVSLCAVIWIASLFEPLHSLKRSVLFFLALAVLGVTHTAAMVSFAEKAGERWRQLWVGSTCGTLDAILTLILLFVCSFFIQFGSQDTMRKTISVLALCVPFVLPPFLIPRIVALIVKTRK